MRTIIHNHFPKVPLSGGSGHGWRDAVRAGDTGRVMPREEWERKRNQYKTRLEESGKGRAAILAALAEFDRSYKPPNEIRDAEKEKVRKDDEAERILHRKAEALYEGSAQRRAQYPGYETRWAYAPNEVRDDFIKRAHAEAAPAEEEDG